MDKEFEIDYIMPEPVPDSFFDREAIKQVMQNLIDNACKYSGGSKKVEVKVSSTHSEIIIEVKDFGIGIKKDEHGEGATINDDAFDMHLRKYLEIDRYALNQN